MGSIRTEIIRYLETKIYCISVKSIAHVLTFIVNFDCSATDGYIKDFL